MTSTERTHETEWQRRQRRNTMRAEHHGRCDICGAGIGDTGLCQAKRGRALDEDHDHTTGRHRGFICARANRLLWSWVTPEWLLRAAHYMIEDKQSNLAYDLQHDILTEYFGE